MEKELLDQINHSEDRLWSYDRDLICTVVNRNMSEDFKTAFGYVLKPGDYILENVPEPLNSMWVERYELALQGEKVEFEDQFDIRGVSSYVKVVLVPIIEDERVVGAACTSRDITERRLAELKVIQNEAYLIAQIENTSDAIWSVDRNYNLLTINTAMTVGYEQAIGVRLSVGDNIVESTPERQGVKKMWKGWYDRALRGEHFKELQTFDYGGETAYVELSFNPIRIASEVAGVACFGKSITELKSSELALKKSLESKDRFFSIVAHDLRGPVGNIRELIKILSAKGMKLSASQEQELIKHLRSASENVYELLDNLLSWAMSQQKMVAVDQKEMVVLEVAEDSIKNYRPSAESKMIATQIDIAPDLMVTADQRSLQSTISNLYNNAIKFTDELGTIKITAVRQEGEILFQIEDTGVGMSPQTMEGLFDESNISSLPGTKKELGTGLGLLLCQEFVKLNKGRIWVKSIEGKGSSFFFTIPD
ncbi:sensor histidine kinase [Reichenbachiella agariperforans]|uniref:sensor histidine kinase n=1 Tax=Reichenbachiella agariperforans TaxID=156994 RepID=UPI001C085421|nr:PAS domain-containing sensor histidine kinase [Reichenbachiella agariperforans]MBU2912523.1 PAS domain-containing sensor histidine kinase [Reichenbachiella agariperforans]